MPLPLAGLAIGGISRVVLGVASLFGVSYALKQVNETAQTVPDTLDKLKSFVIPITVGAVALLVLAVRRK